MKRLGNTIIFNDCVSIISYAAVGGKKESKGPLADKFDVLLTDTKCDEKTWEKAESRMAQQCLYTAAQKCGIKPSDIEGVFAGDLQSQCTATHFAMSEIDVPLIGLYGACSTMTQALALASCLISGKAFNIAAAMSSSHFCTAERQYRTPLMYGGKRTPTSQWTVTGAGAAILAKQGKPPFIKSVTFGSVQNYNINDINNMGAAMAPAAADTIIKHLADTNKSVDDFDAIYTGDLGKVGSNLLHEIMAKEDINLHNHKDCGLIIYDLENQHVKSGASGAACSSCVLCCDVLPKVQKGELRDILFLSTGALMSQTTFLQGEAIPSIAHLAHISFTNN